MLYRLSSCLLRKHLLINKGLRENSLISLCRKTHFYAIKLKNKRLIRVSGADSFIYLQSLLSNDLRHLLNGEEVAQRGCVYAFLLSALGKVLVDLFVYRSDGHLILEVDSHLANAFRRLLISYDINRNISVEAVNDIDLWAIIPKSHHLIPNEENLCFKEVISDDLILVNDPRIRQMGYRLLTRSDGKCFEDIIKLIGNENIEEANVGHYRSHKYKLGVSEGYEDLLSGFYFPFECNGDYLNAISLDKGLYTSEEKIIKVYLKQAIVKRIMPIQFSCTKDQLIRHSPPPFTHIGSDSYRDIGSLRNRKGFDGIASLKVLRNITPVKYNGLYHIQSGLNMKTWRPDWWPQQVNQIYLPEVDYPNSLFKIIPLQQL